MGNNSAYTYWETSVLAAYDTAEGKLTLEHLDRLSEVYRGTDIDAGGATGDLSFDGKNAEQIAVEIVAPDFVSSDEWDYWDEFSEIKFDRWGWR